MNVRLVIALCGLWLIASSAPAMDRWTALSMIESGDNDNAIGTCGEISRFQIRRSLWPGGNSHDPQVALAAAQNLMRLRVAQFEKTHNRPPTDFEFYVLWNAPSKINSPSKCVAERAQRFANLAQIQDNDLQARNSPRMAGS